MANHPNRSRAKDAPPLPFHLPRWLADRERGKQPSKEQIRKLRYFAGPTQREMAALLHVSYATYRAWEDGTTAMHANHWLAMRCACHAFAERRDREARAIRDEHERGISVSSE